METKSAVDHLIEILNEVEFILVDRGDLSTEVGLEKISPAEVHNIINGMGKIYYSYLNYNNTNRDYSFKRYVLEMKNLLVLEQKLFSSKF